MQGVLRMCEKVRKGATMCEWAPCLRGFSHLRAARDPRDRSPGELRIAAGGWPLKLEKYQIVENVNLTWHGVCKLSAIRLRDGRIISKTVPRKAKAPARLGPRRGCGLRRDSLGVIPNYVSIHARCRATVRNGELRTASIISHSTSRAQGEKSGRKHARQ